MLCIYPTIASYVFLVPLRGISDLKDACYCISEFLHDIQNLTKPAFSILSVPFSDFGV
jgi:hypothetical protein